MLPLSLFLSCNVRARESSQLDQLSNVTFLRLPPNRRRDATLGERERERVLKARIPRSLFLESMLQGTDNREAAICIADND